MSDDLSKIRDLSVCKELSEGQLTRFFQKVRVKKVKAGELIMIDGEPGEAMYILKEGEVEIVKNLTLRPPERGGADVEKSVVRLKSDMDDGPCFGEMALLTDAPRSATVRACTSCVLYEVRRCDFEALASEDPDFGYKVLRGLSRRLSNIVRDNNHNILKLTTALSFSLDRKR